MNAAGLALPQAGGPAPHGPWVALGLAALALALGAAPELAGRLEYERATVLGGALHRAWTAHWVHFSPGHLIWDVLGWTALGAACERRDRADLLRTIGLASGAIPLALALARPELDVYRGLSGLNWALAGWLCAELARAQWRAGAPLRAAGLGLATGALALRATLPAAASGGSLVAPLGPGVEPVPLAHGVGFAAGLCLSLRKEIPMRFRILARSLAPCAGLAILLLAAPVAEAQGLIGVAGGSPPARASAEASTRVDVHVYGPARIQVGPSIATATPAPPALPTRPGFWPQGPAPRVPRGPCAQCTPARPAAPFPAPRPALDCSAPARGFSAASERAAHCTYAVLERELEPVVGPWIEATGTIAGAAAGTAVGALVYAPLALLEHWF